MGTTGKDSCSRRRGKVKKRNPKLKRKKKKKKLAPVQARMTGTKRVKIGTKETKAIHKSRKKSGAMKTGSPRKASLSRYSTSGTAGLDYLQVG